MILAFATLAALAPTFAEAWMCSSRSNFDDVSTHVLRELDEKGRQLTANVQWSFDSKRIGAATLLDDAHIKGAGDPPLRAGGVLVSWAGRLAEGADAASPLIVLHLEDEAPRRTDGQNPINRSDGSFSAEVPWSRVDALARRADFARVSLVNANGEAIYSNKVELRQVRRALAAVDEALKETRWQMADFEKRCEPIMEHMKL